MHEKRQERFANDPAVPLMRPKKPKYDASELVKYECYHNLEDKENWSKFSISLPMFGGGTLEETLEWLKNAHKVIEGTRMHNPIKRFEVFTSVLTGDVKAVFTNKQAKLGHQSTNFKPPSSLYQGDTDSGDTSLLLSVVVVKV